MSLEEIISGTGTSRELALDTIRELEQEKVIEGDVETGWALRFGFLVSVFAALGFDDAKH